MNRSIANLKFQIAVFVVISSSALAGLRIDLRPILPVPPGGYEPGADVHVNVFLVDTGNPHGAISFREIFLDFSDSPPWGDSDGTLTYPDPDGVGFLGENGFALINPACDIGCFQPQLPYIFWVYPLSTPNPIFQITMPDNGEVQLGSFKANVGTAGGTIDAMNADNPDPFFGAKLEFGFGGPGDPFTTWRAFTGELTGGVLELPVIPEPASCLLMASVLTMAIVARRNQRRHFP